MSPRAASSSPPASSASAAGSADVPVRLPGPDLSQVVTKDDEPVDNYLSERQIKLLTTSLEASWKPPGGRSFLTLGNVGIFDHAAKLVAVPDVLVSLDVAPPRHDLLLPEHRAYWLSVYSKAPDIVVEIVSNRVGHEAFDSPDHERGKVHAYARIGVAFCVIYDPEGFIQREPLRAFALRDGRYAPSGPDSLGKTGLGLGFSNGDYAGTRGRWLRWFDEGGTLVKTGEEAAREEQVRAEAERQRADEERQRADEERHRADEERQRAEAEQHRADGERDRAETQRARAEAAEARIAELEARLRARM